MLLTIDRVAERYGMLPSQVLVAGTTYDLQVANTAVAYLYKQEQDARQQQQKQSGNKILPAALKPKTPLTQEKMQAAMEWVRNKKK